MVPSPFIKRSFGSFIVFGLLILLSGCSRLEKTVSRSKAPEVRKLGAKKELKVSKNGTRSLGKNWLRKNQNGLWEMYVKGSPYRRGKRIGKLTEPLLAEQERIFIDRIRHLIPSDSYLNFLKYFVTLFTLDLDQHVGEDQLKEIRGVSEAASEEFDFIGPPFYRMLNYHAAHDIGHALQNMDLVSNPIVGCSSFSVNGEKSKDGGLLLGRNFDFHMGDAFAENKIAAFYRPDSGIPFMMVTWPGMTGAVSGMNKKGLTVTLNAARSRVPKKVGTPVSLIGREILQHAQTIDQAFRIAAERRSFVAETFLIGSAEDERSAVIEKTPRRTVLYEPDGERIVCTNHFQSSTLGNRTLTQEHKKSNPTSERYRRLEELIREGSPIGQQKAAEILRDPRGIGGKRIGLGNERALNQFLAHHSIIFKPEKKRVWLSSSPYQLGEYVAYDLDSVFDGGRTGRKLAMEDAGIPPSELLNDGTHERFQRYKELKGRLLHRMEQGGRPDSTESLVQRFVSSNPEYYETYMLLGELFLKEERYGKAIRNFSKALTKEVPREAQKEHIKKGLEKALRKEK